MQTTPDIVTVRIASKETEELILSGKALLCINLTKGLFLYTTDVGCTPTRIYCGLLQIENKSRTSVITDGMFSFGIWNEDYHQISADLNKIGAIPIVGHDVNTMPLLQLLKLLEQQHVHLGILEPIGVPATEAMAKTAANYGDGQYLDKIVKHCCIIK